MTDEKLLPRIVAKSGSEDFHRILDIMGSMLAGAAMNQQIDDLEPAKHTMMTVAAAGVAAGYLAGASIIAGTVNEGDKRRIGEMLLTNFRRGVRLGKNQALMSITENERVQ